MNEETPEQLRKKANQIEEDQRRARNLAQQELEKHFLEAVGIDAYTSDDYCGLRTKNLTFYYGYEVVDENEEWCFEARDDRKSPLLTIPTSKLSPKQGEEPYYYLLMGIGQYFNNLS